MQLSRACLWLETLVDRGNKETSDAACSALTYLGHLGWDTSLSGAAARSPLYELAPLLGTELWGSKIIDAMLTAIENQETDACGFGSNFLVVDLTFGTFLRYSAYTGSNASIYNGLLSD